MNHKLTRLFVCCAGAALLANGLLSGCTQNTRARAFGGTATIDIPAGKKVVNATFKDHDLWVLERNAKPGEKPETLTFKEYSSFGILQGTVIIVEH